MKTIKKNTATHSAYAKMGRDALCMTEIYIFDLSKVKQNNFSAISLSLCVVGIYNLVIYNSSENFNFKIIKQ